MSNNSRKNGCYFTTKFLMHLFWEKTVNNSKEYCKIIQNSQEGL